jgi:hypothetical protein
MLPESGAVRQVLEFTGLLTQFESSSTLEVAVDALRRPV